METWIFIVISLCVAALIKTILSLTSPSPNLPPGPLSIPFIGNLFLLRKSFADLEPVLRGLHSDHGPVVAVRLGSRSIIFVSSRTLAHQALIQNGAVFADRPPPGPTIKILSSNQHSVNTAAYGPTWRALRRNMMSEILHPARVRSYAGRREWVLGSLLDRLRSDSGEAVGLIDHFQYAMFSLLVLMCFGDRLEEKQIKEIEEVHRAVLLRGDRFRVLNMFPRTGKVLFRGRWKEFEQLGRNRDQVLLPLIRARSEGRGKARERKDSDKDDKVVCYVDTLFDVRLPDNNRSLTEAEMVTLSSEFLNAGTDTTATALQWIMANLVKNPSIQSRIFDEIKETVGSSSSATAVAEDDLEKLPYLKAVVLEGLRRHPPAHFLLFHAVTEETELGGYVVPRKWSVNFMVAEMGMDPAVWEDPTAFKPERFLSGATAVDITGSREIKMMPFGVGRRMCPAYNLALLHLEYFVANLVWAYEWNAAVGDDVDLSEKQEFTMVMKNPLKAIISPRLKKC